MLRSSSGGGSPSLLGFEINGSQDAIQLREAAYKQAGNDPRVIPTFDDTDIPVLLGLGILYRRRDGSLARHPLLPTTNEDIVQFFRWAVGNEKHPLPPLVRRILCVKRDILQESAESLYTSPLQRTGQRKLLGEIEVLLKNDGVKDLDAACTGREPLASLGAWAAPPLQVNLGALKGPTCDYSSLQVQLERVVETLGSLKPSDETQQEVLDLLDELLSVLGSTESALTNPPAALRNQFESLRTGIQASKEELKQADARQVKTILMRIVDTLKNQIVAVNQVMKTVQEQDKGTNTQKPRATETRSSGGSRLSRRRQISTKKNRVTRRRSLSYKHRHS